MKAFNWFLFIILCVIWGSSFILMKEGMRVLSPYQVASVRIFSAGIVLAPFAFRALKQLPRGKVPVVIVSGLLGSFFPAYLFCIAETRIDSSLAGILNALTPLFTVVIGISFFQLKAGTQKLAGIAIGFAGLVLLFTGNGRINFQDLSFSLLALVATIMYGINVNMIGYYMKNISSFNIATIAFSFLTIPCLLILYFTGYFNLPFHNPLTLWSTAASSLLGIMGTATASILFYMLLKRAGTLFASMVTYGMPIVALAWGFFYGEKIAWLQVLSMAIILLGVYLANMPPDRLAFLSGKTKPSSDQGL